jgi:beta-glucosidase
VLSGSAPSITTEQFLFNPKLLESRVQLAMNAEQNYYVKLVTHSREMMVGEPTPYGATLCFEEHYSTDEAISEAADLAAQSDVSVVFAGRNGQHESEGFDLSMILLPDNQTNLIKAVAAASKRTILVLYCGNPIDVSPYVEEVDAIVVTHFPGQEGGQALADIITGKVNPSGKLATTWFRKLSDAPSFQHFPASLEAEHRPEIRYTEGIAVGYRSPDADMKARYQFGFGLSYTTFGYSNIEARITPNDKKEKPSNLQCSFTVTNTGFRVGKEAVQLFISCPNSVTAWRPRRELKAFTKVSLQPGEELHVVLNMDLLVACSYWDETASSWRMEKGLYTAHVEECKCTFEIIEEVVWNSL